MPEPGSPLLVVSAHTKARVQLLGYRLISIFCSAFRPCSSLFSWKTSGTLTIGPRSATTITAAFSLMSASGSRTRRVAFRTRASPTGDDPLLGSGGLWLVVVKDEVPPIAGLTVVRLSQRSPPLALRVRKLLSAKLVPSCSHVAPWTKLTAVLESRPQFVLLNFVSKQFVWFPEMEFGSHKTVLFFFFSYVPRFFVSKAEVLVEVTRAVSRISSLRPHRTNINPCLNLPPPSHLPLFAVCLHRLRFPWYDYHSKFLFADAGGEKVWGDLDSFLAVSRGSAKRF